MATHTFKVPTDASETITPTATTPAGDKYVLTAAQARKDVLLLFTNGHASPITVTIAGVAKTIDAGNGFGEGTFTRASREIVVTNGTVAGLHLTSAELKAYLDEENELNIAYTGGNAAMTLMGFNI
jgi:hypothetical protein